MSDDPATYTMDHFLLSKREIGDSWCTAWQSCADQKLFRVSIPDTHKCLDIMHCRTL